MVVSIDLQQLLYVHSDIPNALYRDKYTQITESSFLLFEVRSRPLQLTE
jgi:hypothetical protein